MGILRFNQSSSLPHNGSNGARDSDTLFWGRADIDGAPYRGRPTTLKREEWDGHVDKNHYFHFGLFDVSKPDQKHDGYTYREVMDHVLNNWFVILDRQRITQRNKKTGAIRVLIYVEWAIPIMEELKK